MRKEGVRSRRRSASIGAIAGCVLGLLLLSASMGSADNTHSHKDSAVDCWVDGFRYVNDGTYTVSRVDLVFVTARYAKSVISAEDYANKLGFNVYSGGSANIDLNQLENVGGDVANSKLKDGMEVWPKVKILEGEYKSCHKDGHRLIYKKGIGRTIHFKSGGTTKNNNNCQYAENIKNQCSDLPKQEPR